MRRIAAVLVAAFLAATTLTGCGGSGNSSAEYCSALRGAEAKIKGLTLSDPANRQKVVKVVKGIADKAPSKVSSDWKLLTKLLDDPTSFKASDATKLQMAATELAKDARSRCKVGFNLD